MDLNRAIVINQAALSRIVAGLIAMVGLSRGGRLGRLPQPLWRAVSRVLVRAESAVRRLIVIAARGLVAKLPPVRPMPKGLALAAKGSGRVSFALFDPRQRFGRLRRRRAKLEPRIHLYDSSPLIPLFQPRRALSPLPEPDDTVNGQRLGRRLAAIKMALENLPRQARRMARLRVRRANVPNLHFRAPIRPGPPPGHRKMAEEEIDFVLRECHALAWDALRPDTS